MTDAPDAPQAPKPVTVDEARKMVEAERTTRAQACLDALDAVLRTHRCALAARIERHGDATGEHLHLRAVPLVIPEP
jgi:hypothetical protein